MTPLLFMHIHKTGGQSLSRFLEQFFSPDEICPANTDHSILAQTPKDLSQYKFFRGHISIHGLSQRLREFTTVTVLREPRERLISAFHFWQQKASANEPYLPAIMRRFPTMTFADFLSAPETRHCCDNVQARLLAGGRYGTTNDERIMVYGDPHPLQQERLSYIGTTDALDVAASAICELIGVRPPARQGDTLVGRLNVGSRPRSSLSSLEETLISQRTEHDWMLFRSVKAAQEDRVPTN